MTCQKAVYSKVHVSKNCVKNMFAISTLGILNPYILNVVYFVIVYHQKRVGCENCQLQGQQHLRNL